MEEVRRLNDKDFKVTAFNLSEAIILAGVENVVFEIKDASGGSKLYVIQDRGSGRRYNPSYKIYMISTDLTTLEDFYFNDLVSLVDKGEVKVHYRFDLIYSDGVRKKRLSAEEVSDIKMKLFGSK